MPKTDIEIGYASILTWVRAFGFMGIAAFLWVFLALDTVALNAAIGLGILASIQWFYVGLFFMDIVMCIVMVLYLVLPIERIPKTFRYFEKQKPEGYNEGPAQ